MTILISIRYCKKCSIFGDQNVRGQTVRLLHVLSRGQNILLSVAKKSSGGDLVAKMSVAKTSVAKLSGYRIIHTLTSPIISKVSMIIRWTAFPPIDLLSPAQSDGRQFTPSIKYIKS